MEDRDKKKMYAATYRAKNREKLRAYAHHYAAKFKLGKRNCINCGREFEVQFRGKIKNCSEQCAQERERARKQTAEYRANAALYAQRPDRRFRQWKIKQSPEAKRTAAAYRQRPEAKAAQRIRQSSPEYRAAENAAARRRTRRERNRRLLQIADHINPATLK